MSDTVPANATLSFGIVNDRLSSLSASESTGMIPLLWYGLVAVPLTAISVANGTLTFGNITYGYTFTGKIGTSTIDGTFTQSGQNLPLSFARP